MLIDQPGLRDHWYVVAEAAELGDHPLAVRLLGEDLVVWRSTDGSIVAAPDRCPHREAPLTLGKIEDGRLVCAYHGWTFGDSGRCVAVPSAAPGVPVPPKAHLPAVCAAERYGLIWVCLGTPQRDVPRICEGTTRRSGGSTRVLRSGRRRRRG
jgi:phenylpropionate dioxygenase-like ring-hydroxylating dioxygenase large terminal subunit